MNEMDPNGLPPVAEVEHFVRSVLSPGRFAHVQGVVKTVKGLARQQGADEEKAVLAAWLHDVAKEYTRDEALLMADQFGIIFTEIELLLPALWHAPLGAAVAAERFGITDGDVLAAIRFHTTGRAGMSPLEQVVFLADIIEPGRTFPGVGRLRAMSGTNFHGALLAALEGTLRRIVEEGELMHPDTVGAWNDLVLHRSQATPR